MSVVTAPQRPRKIAARLAVGLALTAAATMVGTVDQAVEAAPNASPIVTQFDITSPLSDSEFFGREVLVLSNGNYAVTDPGWDDGPTEDVGAVFLFDGDTNTMISNLVGSTADDFVGFATFGPSVLEVGNSDFVVRSPFWDNGTDADVGAVTFIDGETGFTGSVSTTNSLHGVSAGDELSSGGITTLTDGSYVVSSPKWDGREANVGAVTWATGKGPTVGPVTIENSLYGTSVGDQVGTDTTALTNGHYVVRSIRWDNGPITDAGAATWANGNGTTTGPVTTTNSLHGTTDTDQVGNGGATALPNGNYVVRSPSWDNGAAVNVGAVTWSDGDGTTTGPVTTTNSLHGTTDTDLVGFHAPVALTNGHYVVAAHLWDNGAAVDVGAVTWANGNGTTTGPVTTTNSLHGTTTGDAVGSVLAWALTTGDYVVSSPDWDNGATADVGAATWADGETGRVGPVTTSNSLHGTTAGNRVAAGGVMALTEGDYVVRSRDWDNGTVLDVGAATWSDGDGSTKGAVTTSNSLYGTTADDQVSSNLGVAFDDGNYAIFSEHWNNGGAVDAGAVTFGRADGGVTGPVTTSNSVIGTPPDKIKAAGNRLTSNDAIVIPTFQNRVLIMRVDRSPFFTTTPANVTATTPPGAAGATITYGVPTASDVRDLGSIPVACAPASGTVFPVGSTTVTCTATDSAALTATTSFTATVTATPAVPDPDPDPDPDPGPDPDPDPDPDPRPDPVDAFTSLAPERFVDTRANGDTLDNQFEKTGKRGTDTEYRVQIAGRGAVPANAAAAIVNITAIAAEGTGFITAHPCNSPRPNASSLNYTAGVNLGNEIIATLTNSGELCLYTQRAAHLTVDVSGYVAASAPTVALTPARFLDTRANGETFDGQSRRGGVPGAGNTTTLQITGRNQIPAGAAAVIINVTAIRPVTSGFATVHPCLGEPPLASSLNHVAGVNRANEIIATLDSQGRICVFTSADTHLAADVVGYLPAGSSLAPVGPSRLLDTRATGDTIDDLNQRDGILTGGTEYTLQIAGRPGVSADATSAVVNLTAIRPTGRGFATIHPCLPERPLASSLNYVQGVNGGNEVITRLDAQGRICIYVDTTTHISVDIVATT